MFKKDEAIKCNKEISEFIFKKNENGLMVNIILLHKWFYGRVKYIVELNPLFFVQDKPPIHLGKDMGEISEDTL